MNRQSVLGVFLGILMILAGCQDATSPKGSGLLIEKQRQTGATQLSDDTSDSEIVSPQYPKGTTVIVAVGDSITYGWGTWTGGYPTKLQAKLLADGSSVRIYFVHETAVLWVDARASDISADYKLSWRRDSP